MVRGSISYSRMPQVTLYDISYDLDYLDSWIVASNNLIASFNISAFSYQVMASLNFTCQTPSTQVVLDKINSSNFSLSDSPHSIWPRPDESNFNSWKPPDAVVNYDSNSFIYNISESTPNIYMNVSEQWQGVPIIQTRAVTNLTQNNINFLIFQPNGVIEINIAQVNQVGLIQINIQNQVKLQIPDPVYFVTINYIWNDPIAFTFKLINEPPFLQSNLSEISDVINKELTINLVFIDVENDQVQINIKSDLFSFDSNASIQKVSKNNYKILWTPTAQDAKTVNVNLTYFDQFHILNPQLAQFKIAVSSMIDPYFASDLTTATIFAGQQTKIDIPVIMNPSNVGIDFK